MPGSRAEKLAALKQQVASLDRHPVLADGDAGDASTGLLATPAGVVHEVFADTPIEAGAALGFALAQARAQLRPGRPGLLILQLKSDAQELGFPYAPGLAGFGLAADAVVLIRTDTITELLWAMEEAIACRAVAAVVADIAQVHRALDFTASRRLALRTASSGCSVFVVRYARDREASAARYRWHVAAGTSRPPPFDARAPGGPRWRITLEKGSLGRRRAGPETYLVDWTEHGITPADIGGKDRSRIAGDAPLSPAASAALGHRLSEAG